MTPERSTLTTTSSLLTPRSVDIDARSCFRGGVQRWLLQLPAGRAQGRDGQVAAGHERESPVVQGDMWLTDCNNLLHADLHWLDVADRVTYSLQAKSDSSHVRLVVRELYICASCSTPQKTAPPFCCTSVACCSEVSSPRSLRTSRLHRCWSRYVECCLRVRRSLYGSDLSWGQPSVMQLLFSSEHRLSYDLYLPVVKYYSVHSLCTRSAAVRLCATQNMVRFTRVIYTWCWSTRFEGVNPSRDLTDR